MVEVIAEIGINHNGDLANCLNMISAAKVAGADYVKFQKRDPDVCVPEAEKSKIRSTPWGDMTYIDYKHRIEFGYDEYKAIDEHCKKLGIGWFVSVWDTNSVEFMKQFDTSIVKIPSAKAVDFELISACADVFDSMIISTGMCTIPEIKRIVAYTESLNCTTSFMHCVSAYPVDTDVLVMDTIDWLKSHSGRAVGYSSHETEIVTAAATVYKGVRYIERHFTTDKTMWGTDQQASSDLAEMTKLVNYVRLLESSLGKRVGVIDCEQPNLEKMR